MITVMYIYCMNAHVLLITVMLIISMHACVRACMHAHCNYQFCIVIIISAVWVWLVVISLTLFASRFRCFFHLVLACAAPPHHPVTSSSSGVTLSLSSSCRSLKHNQC